MSEGEMMLAAGLMICEAARGNAEVLAMKSHDDWEIKFGSGSIYTHDAYVTVVGNCYDPQVFINQAREASA